MQAFEAVGRLVGDRRDHERQLAAATPIGGGTDAERQPQAAGLVGRGRRAVVEEVDDLCRRRNPPCRDKVAGCLGEHAHRGGRVECAPPAEPAGGRSCRIADEGRERRPVGAIRRRRRGRAGRVAREDADQLQRGLEHRDAVAQPGGEELAGETREQLRPRGGPVERGGEAHEVAPVDRGQAVQCRPDPACGRDHVDGGRRRFALEPGNSRLQVGHRVGNRKDVAHGRGAVCV